MPKWGRTEGTRWLIRRRRSACSMFLMVRSRDMRQRTARQLLSLSPPGAVLKRQNSSKWWLHLVKLYMAAGCTKWSNICFRPTRSLLSYFTTLLGTNFQTIWFSNNKQIIDHKVIAYATLIQQSLQKCGWEHSLDHSDNITSPTLSNNNRKSTWLGTSSANRAIAIP